MKVIIAGGGTGGHIYPAIAIGHALQQLQDGTELLFVGAIGKMEMEKIPQEGFRIIGLDIRGFDRGNLLKNWALPFKLWNSRKKAQKILREFRPDVVVGVGGYASFPVLHAAQQAGIPTLIQEQNSFAGRSNKILGKKARAICVAYEEMDRFFPAEKLSFTGNPVRSDITRAAISKSEGCEAFGLDAEQPVVLVVGGSLGARSINEAILEHLPELDKMGVQLIWQTGKLFIDEATKAVADYPQRFLTRPFISNMEYAYAAADVIISRAGALASAELCIVAKPVIFVPYPYAAEDHQTSNALALVAHNAALMVRDNEVKTELLQKLKMLLNDRNMQRIMSEELAKMAIKDAAIRIAQKVIEIANGKTAHK